MALDPRREYWGRVHDMVDAYNAKHGTDVKPWECVRCGNGFFLPDENNYRTLYSHPEIKDTNHTTYRFAITIIEGKPVFFKDKIYSKTGYPFKWNDLEYLNHFNYENAWTWIPPKQKRTFTLNGVELPCPLKPIAGGDVVFCDYLLLGRRFYFKDEEEREKCLEAFCCLLEAARDKE